MAMDKRDWANIAAGTVAAIAILFGVSQCNGKKNAVRDYDELKSGSAVVLDQVKDGVSELRKGVKDLRKDAEEIKDMIEDHDDTVNAKLDTLQARCDRKQDCKCNDNCKGGKDCKCCVKKPVKKPVAKKKPVVAPVKAEPVKVAEVKDQTPVVLVTKDTVLVRGQTEKPAQTVVITGDNNGNVIVNNGGVVNANDNVNGHDNNVNSAAAERKRRMYMDACRTTVRIKTGERVKCY